MIYLYRTNYRYIIPLSIDLPIDLAIDLSTATERSSYRPVYRFKCRHRDGFLLANNRSDKLAEKLAIES